MWRTRVWLVYANKGGHDQIQTISKIAASTAVELLYTVPVLGQLHALYVESYKPERKRQDKID